MQYFCWAEVNPGQKTLVDLIDVASKGVYCLSAPFFGRDVDQVLEISFGAAKLTRWRIDLDPAIQILAGIVLAMPAKSSLFDETAPFPRGQI